MSLGAHAQEDGDEEVSEENSEQRHQEMESRELEKITVDAPDYVSTGSRTATKSDAPLVETPQSVTVISRDQIELLHWTSLEDTVKYTAGAVGGVFGPDTRYDWLLVRGFSPVQFIDGLQAPIGSVSNVGTDLYGYESVEILKGPSAVLYGQTPPGGIVNMTSRRPEPQFSGEIGGQIGNYERGELHGDVTGPLGETLSGRFTFLYRDQDNQVDFTNSERLYVAPAVTWDVSRDTSITFLSYYQNDAIDNHSTGFLPAFGTRLPNPVGEVPRDRNIGEPGINFYDREQYGVGYDFGHTFNETFRIEQNLKYFTSDIESREIFGTGLLDADGNGVPDDFRTVTRSDFPFNEEITSFSVDTRGYFDFVTGGLEHSMLVGLDHRDYDAESEFGFAPAPSIDLFDPEYGADIPFPTLFPFTDQEQEQLGFYVQDQIRVNNWVFTLNGRHDSLDTVNSGTETDDSETTYRFGVNYLFENGLAPYVQVASSFQPVPGADFDGNPFEPSTGEQVEVGLKYSPSNAGDDLNVFGTIAAYNIVQENVLTPDPDHLFFSVQAGEVEVQGVELEGVARWKERYSLNASYTYIDSEVTESNGPDLGKRIPMVPEHKVSLLADYQATRNFGVNFGVRYKGTAWGDPANTIQSPAVLLFDATLRYDYGPWRFALNSSNLTNEEYVARCDGVTNCFFGKARTIIASFTRQF